MTSSALPATYGQPATEILHATDFTAESSVALAHALRLALANRGSLHLLHVADEDDDEANEFPSIRQILERWGSLPPHASRSAVRELGIGIKKVVGLSPNVVDSIVSYCHRHPIDMLVLATAGRDGLAAWLKPSQAERAAEQVSILSIPTLFVPAGCRSCVNLDNGGVSLHRVLAPVDQKPRGEAAVERGLRALSMFGGKSGTLTLLHVGAESSFPKIDIPDGPWQVERVVRKGNAAAEILAAAEQLRSDLIIMVTEGTNGFLDVLRGSTTDQVLRQAPCPVLAIPALF